MPGPLLHFLLLGCLCLYSTLALASRPENPLHSGDAIYVSSQGVYAFDADSGKATWSSLAGVETYAPVAYRDLILVGSTQGLYALDADSGDLRWHIEKQHTIFSPSTADRAFAGSVHGVLYAIDADTGRIAWRRQFPGWIYSPAIDQKSARLWTGGQPHWLFALNTDDGSLLREIPSAQETVFSPLFIGAGRIAFNLFDGSSVIVDSALARIAGIIPGSSQPTDLQRRAETVYRAHGDGLLVAFDRRSLRPAWQQSVTAQNLKIHPSLPGYLLLGDGDRELLLYDLAKAQGPCRLQGDGGWLLPIQVGARRILHVRRQLQPLGITLVQTQANCN